MIWPPDYSAEYARRAKRIIAMRKNPVLIRGAHEYYKRPENAAAWVEHWGVTYDPRVAGTGRPAKMPFLLFDRQRDLVTFLIALLQGQTNGLIEKARDMGATWICASFSVYLWRYWDGAAVGWGSRKEQLVDKLGDPDSIFEKMRMIIRMLPPDIMWPKGFRGEDDMPFMRILNPETGSTITGEAGDNIGRGGRKLIYFKDESAHYERPEKIEAALGDNTNCQVDISSVNGVGNVFHRRREAGVEWEPGQPIAKDRTNVFVMDWSDHPAKDATWFATRKKKFEDEGLAHVFAQEVERNYAASVNGIIIPAEWVPATIDAHEKLGFKDDGAWLAALDVADEGLDLNALAARKGVVLRKLKDWGSRDTAVAAREALGMLENCGEMEFHYDSIGVGAGVKAEANRLKDEKVWPTRIKLVPWNAGAAVINPQGRVLEGDSESPINEDYYANLKAQGWWELRMRFWRTFKAVTEGAKYPSEQLISLSSKDIDKATLRKLQKELSQPVMIRNTKMKLLVDKKPEGTKSPNLGDCVMMAYWPARGATGFLDAIAAEARAMDATEKKRLAEIEERDKRLGAAQQPAPSNADAWLAGR